MVLGQLLRLRCPFVVVRVVWRELAVWVYSDRVVEDDIIEGFRTGPQYFIRLELGALLKLDPIGNAVEYVPHPNPQLWWSCIYVCSIREP